MPAPKDPVRYAIWIVEQRERHKGKKRPPRTKDWCENISKAKKNPPDTVRKKMSEVMLKYLDEHPEARIKNSERQKGKKMSDEFKEKRRLYMLERFKDPIERVKQSQRLSGENNPFFGKTHSDNVLEKLKQPKSAETRKKLSESRIGRFTGEDNPNWTGGSKEYCEKWTAEFRRRIRAFFDYKCAECGTPQNEKLLHCHHVYYDKKACCSVSEDGKYFSNLGIKGKPFTFEIIGDPNKFIALCDTCHKSTGGKKNREYWARHFEETINNYYLGKSYYTKEEYDKIR
jgi:hypothetical protein